MNNIFSSEKVIGHEQKIHILCIVVQNVIEDLGHLRHQDDVGAVIEYLERVRDVVQFDEDWSILVKEFL